MPCHSVSHKFPLIIHSNPLTRGFRSLAYAELYITLATLFRRFDMELHETDRSCVDPKYDYFAPFPENDDLGNGRVRVLIK